MFRVGWRWIAGSRKTILTEQGVRKVTKTQISAALAALVLAAGLAGPAALAQQPGQARMAPNYGGGRVALLDVSYIFREHLRFKSMMNDMKADVQAAEASMKKEVEAIQALTEQLREDFKPGTPQYKQMEEHVTHRRADMSVKVSLQRKEFLQNEAKIYHTVYQEIQQEVQYFASRNGISAVLRFSGEKADVEQPEEVLRDINKSVVWFGPGLDITADILRSLNSRAGNPAAATGTVPYPASRQGVPFKR